MKKYQKITSDILSLVDINDKNVKLFIDSNYFRDAFIHKSIDPHNNYEYLEFRGDAFVNLAISRYIKNRFPLITSQKWLTKMYHNLRSTAYLSQLATDLKFNECVSYSSEIKYRSINNILEDCFESFFGAIVTVSDKHWEMGVGYSLAYSIISKLYTSYNLPLDYEQYFDYKPRVKEIFDAMKWVFKNETLSYDVNQRKHFAKMTIYPKGDKSVKPENAIEIEGFSFKSSEEASSYLYKFILNTLKKYGINEKSSDPYTIDIGEINHTYPNDIIPKDFKDKIKKILELSGLSEDLVDKFSGGEYLIEFRKCFIDKSYDPYNNVDTYKFEGSPVIECVVVDYLFAKLNHVENLLTHAKHKIIGKSGIFEKIYNDFEFKKYFLIVENINTEDVTYNSSVLESKLIKSSIKSLFGCLASILDKHIRIGIGYRAAYNFLSKYLDTIKISHDITENLSYKSQLKEYYDRHFDELGSLNNNIIHSIDDEKNHIIQIRFKNKIISKAKSKIKVDAMENASMIALKKLCVI